MRKVIYDHDHHSAATLMLLQSEAVDLLGITTVASDTAYALRFLQQMGTDIPVFMGADRPLLNTKTVAQKRSGPEIVGEHAVDFIIRTVRAHPGEVTLCCGGPLTNLALAVMLDPGIVPLTPEVVFMGGGIHFAPTSLNVLFDPEAAKIAFRAPWPKFTVVTVDLAGTVHMGDEMLAAQIVDPSIFTSKVKMYVDVVTDDGGHYGDTSFWDEDWASQRVGTPLHGQNNPSIKAGLVTVLKDLDKKRFREFIEQP